jgi:hypothetical protein
VRILDGVGTGEVWRAGRRPCTILRLSSSLSKYVQDWALGDVNGEGSVGFGDEDEGVGRDQFWGRGPGCGWYQTWRAELAVGGDNSGGGVVGRNWITKVTHCTGHFL